MSRILHLTVSQERPSEGNWLKCVENISHMGCHKILFSHGFILRDENTDVNI